MINPTHRGSKVPLSYGVESMLNSQDIFKLEGSKPYEYKFCEKRYSMLGWETAKNVYKKYSNVNFNSLKKPLIGDKN